MGARIVIPEPDLNMQKAIQRFMFTAEEIGLFTKPFSKLDKEKSGTIKVEDLLTEISMNRSIFTDGMFDLFNIDYTDGEINFCDFFTIVTNYCFMETADILKYCIYLFDQDKSGLIQSEDVRQLMLILHDVTPPETIKGQVKKSWLHVEFDSDDRVEFPELLDLHRKFPRLFQPALMLQEQMMINILGRTWWNRKKIRLRYLTELADLKLKKQKENEDDRMERERTRKIKKRMGLMRYYCCFWQRHLFDPYAEQIMSLEEKKRREAELKRLRREANLRAKNPETTAWDNYKKRVEPARGGAEKYIVEKLDQSALGRGARVEARAERRQKRKKATHGNFSEF